MKKLILSVLAGALVASTANAQEEAVEAAAPAPAPLVFGGSVDSYYRTTLNTSDQGDYSAPGTSFANGVGFNIGMINLVASKEGEKSGFVADLAFGSRGSDAVFNSNPLVDGSNFTVNQAYVYYNINDMLTFSLGNFNTFLGYEVISPSVNFNYSTSYMFSYGPFSHTGAKLDIAATDELSFMVAALNPTDEKTLGGLGNNLFLGLQAGYELDNGGVWVNYLGGNGGPDGSDTTAYHQIDLTTGFNWTEDLYLGLNATVATQGVSSSDDENEVSSAGFWGVAGYASYAINSNIALGGRVEYFTDNNDFTGVVPQFTTDMDEILQANTTGSVLDLTLSANIKAGDLTFIPEIRADFYNQLDTSDDNTDGKPQWTDLDGTKIGAIGSVSLAAVYTF